MFFYIRKLKRLGVNCDDFDARRKSGIISGIVGVLLNVLLFSGKLAVALTSGSVAIIADAFNNLSDAGSSIIAMVGFKLSGKKPDPEHPFGHGRFEYITGFIVSMVIILMGFELAVSSLRSLGSNENLRFSQPMVVILCASIVVKLYMACYNRLLYKLFKSPSMNATTTDSLSDVIATTAVLASLIISHYTSLNLDSYAGLLVSGFIMYSGISSAKETLEPLLGAPPSREFIAKVESIVMAHPPIVGMHDLVVHDYGPGRLIMSLHAEIPSDIDVFEAHCIIDDLENVLDETLGCEAVIHFDPINVNDKELDRLKAIVEEIVHSISRDITLHDFRHVPGGTHTNLLFDIVVPFNSKLSDEELKLMISDRVETRLPHHNCVIKCDRGCM
ncbi:MAG: cation diffusion facilitator family transporter [Oscillospiraceae bacterium]